MKTISNNTFAAGATLAAFLGLLAMVRQPAPQSQPAALQTTSVQAASSGALPERTSEYDYDPPQPGTYQLPPLKAAADGVVLGPNGKPTRLHELFKGRVVILSFIYTRCTDPRACLRATGVLNQLHELSRHEPEVARNLLLVTLSFDPGHDTPEVMARYGSVFQQNEGGAEWLFLSARSPADLQPLLEAYGQRVDKRKQPSPLGPYQHTLKVYLIDPEQRLRNIYNYELLDPRLVFVDVQTLLLQQQEEFAGH